MSRNSRPSELTRRIDGLTKEIEALDAQMQQLTAEKDRETCPDKKSALSREYWKLWSKKGKLMTERSQLRGEEFDRQIRESREKTDQALAELRVRVRIAETCAKSYDRAEAERQRVAQERAARDAALARRPGDSKEAHAIRMAFRAPCWQDLLLRSGGIR